jgi:hypothetical protein
MRLWAWKAVNVVEIMRHTSGRLAHRFHFLGLAQLFL